MAQVTEQKPGIFVCTPAYGGLLHYTYVDALMSTFNWAGRENVPFAVYMLGNESLITRGRNKCCAEFLKSGLQKLLFIDADVSWKERDIWRLYHSERTLVGGTYPIKALPLSLNVNPVREQEVAHFTGVRRPLKEYAAWASACADSSGEVEVRHLPTGFMMIDRDVLLALQPHVATYQHIDMKKDTVEIHHEYFSCGTHEGSYESEDWRLSRMARDAGHPPFLNVNVILPHTGNHTYEAPVRG